MMGEERGDWELNAKASTMGSDDLQIDKGLAIPGWELWFTASGSGGPGGQHANTTNSAVTLHWSVAKSSVLSKNEKRRLQKNLKRNMTQDGVLQVGASDTRSQHRNRKVARERMAQQVKKGIKKKKRRVKTRPTRASRRRRLQNKRHRGRIKKLRKTPRRDDW